MFGEILKKIIGGITGLVKPAYAPGLTQQQQISNINSSMKPQLDYYVKQNAANEANASARNAGIANGSIPTPTPYPPYDSNQSTGTPYRQVLKEYKFNHPVPTNTSVPPLPYQGKPGIPNYPVFNGLLGKNTNGNRGNIDNNPIGNSNIEQLIKKYFPEDTRTAIAVFKHESQLGKFFQNLQGVPAYGIAQIYLPAHREQIPGATDAAKIEWLKNPENNLKLARQIYDASGWNPWESYITGKYKQYL